jgi:hypothetical protein
VQLHEDFDIEHLCCIDPTTQLTAKLACDDKNFGLDADGNPCKHIQKCKAIVGHYRSSTQAAQKRTEKLRAAGITFKVLVQDTPTIWFEMEEEISLSKENHLTESEWKTSPYLLELLQPFK